MLIVDAGVFLAAADNADRDHKACAALLASEPGPFVTTALIIAEAAYLIERQLGSAAGAAFFHSIQAGEITGEVPNAPDWQRIAERIEQYRDLPLGRRRRQPHRPGGAVRRRAPRDARPSALPRGATGDIDSARIGPSVLIALESPGAEGGTVAPG